MYHYAIQHLIFATLFKTDVIEASHQSYDLPFGVQLFTLV